MCDGHTNITQVAAQFETMRQAGVKEDTAARMACSEHIGWLPDAGFQYEQWSREQLYDKAQALGIDERTKMTKWQLQQAVRDAESHP